MSHSSEGRFIVRAKGKESDSQGALPPRSCAGGHSLKWHFHFSHGEARHLYTLNLVGGSLAIVEHPDQSTGVAKIYTCVICVCVHVGMCVCVCNL